MTAQGLGASPSPPIGGSITLWPGFAAVLKPACARLHGSSERPTATALAGVR
jgi:hypothetical protein